MLNFLPHVLIGILTSILLALNSFFWVPILVLLALVKFATPWPAFRLKIDPVILFIAEAWIGCNSAWMTLTQRTTWDVQGIAELPAKSWYLVNSNHQSWADIFVLQHLLTRRIPLLKFFLKQELIWVPVMGLAWWALDFPFMRRHSEAYLKQHPEMRGKDQETTRKACEKFALIPTSVMNFLEGTRFTKAKHARQQSPYRHLLKPKAGGIALALNAMGEKFHSILDVTIVYPDGAPNFWQFLCGDLKHVVVHVQTLPVPPHLLGGDYANDPQVREAYSLWVKELWQHKDQKITDILANYSV
ncbi:MAG: acyltransferase [Rhodocyclaceae bacterium]|nr:acyltransferase [Rhodocyclaceae bacterium]